MERLFIYLAVAAAVFSVLVAYLPRVALKPDYCAEARRFAAALRTAYLSRGSYIDTFLLRDVAVSSSGVSCASCGVSVSVPVDNRLGVTALNGRWRIRIYHSQGRVVLEP